MQEGNNMGDEIDIASRFQTLSQAAREDILAVLRSVYGGGYVNQKRTFEDMKQLRAQSYRALKALGVEK